MSVATARTPALGQASVGVWPIAQSAAVVSVGLYAVALMRSTVGDEPDPLPAQRGQCLLRQPSHRTLPRAAAS